jgi:hypothetical protein
LFRKEKGGLKCIDHWRLLDVFKIFIDFEESTFRLVLKIEETDTLITRDFRSVQLKNILARLKNQTDAIGLSMIG